jgi:hypothetical protein
VHRFALTLLLLPAAALAQERARLLAVRAGGDEKASSIELVGDRPLSFTTLKLQAPPRVVVDLADTEVAPEAQEVAVDDGTVKRVAAAAAGQRTARVVIELEAEAEFDVRTHGDSVEVRIPRPALVAAQPPPASAGEQRSPAQSEQVNVVHHEAPAAASGKREKAAAAQQAARERRVAAEQKAAADRKARAAAAAEKRRLAAEEAAWRRAPQRKLAMVQRHAITGIGFRPIEGGEIIVRSDHPLEYGVTGDDNALLLHLPSAGIPLANNRRPLDTHYFGGPVQRVVPLAKENGTDLRIELNRHAEYQLAQSGTVLTVTFSASR